MKSCCLCSNPSHTNYKNLPLCKDCFNQLVNNYEFWSVLLDKIKAYFDEKEPASIIDLEEYKRRKL